MVAHEEESVNSNSTLDSPPKIPSRVNCRHKIQRQIASGSLGVVHEGIDLVTGEVVAVKFEWTKAGTDQLLHEARLYKELAGTHDVPQVYWTGTEGEYNIMVLELLGPNLYDLFERHRFNMETVLKFWEQMIDRLMFLHSRGIIHRDLKPHIFLVGTSRRDDLISVGYVAVMLLVRKLPWQNCTGEQTSKCKRDTTHKDLCKGLPDNFVDYLDYTYGLAYDDTPDYDYLKQLIRNPYVHESLQEDVVPCPVRDGCSLHEKEVEKSETQ